MAKPVHEIRLGLIKAKVWRRGKRLPAIHTVSLSRLYRDGRVWKESTRFAPEDLPALRLALDLAYEWVFSQRQEPSGTSAELLPGPPPASTGREYQSHVDAPSTEDARPSDGQCEHTIHAVNDNGRTTGSWQVDRNGDRPRVVCSVCGKFYGFLRAAKGEEELERAYRTQQGRLACPGCGEEPFVG